MSAMFVMKYLWPFLLRILPSNYYIGYHICRELIAVRYTRRDRHIIKRETRQLYDGNKGVSREQKVRRTSKTLQEKLKYLCTARQNGQKTVNFSQALATKRVK